MTVFTIGYEKTDIDRFVATLKAVGIQVLADVRAVALSRKKGFSKTALRQRLQAEGIEYLHFIELGDPKPGRDAARAGEFADFRRIYAKHLTASSAQTALKAIAKIAHDRPTCLLCFEREPSVCHRSIVADRLKARGLAVIDIYGDAPERYVNHAKKLTRDNPRQSIPQPQPEVW